MESIVTMSREDLRALISEEVTNALRNNNPEPKKEAPVLDLMRLKPTVEFLQENGLIHINQMSLYAMVHEKKIPYKKMGRSLYFSKKELLAWIEGRLRSSDHVQTQSASNLAKSANNQKE